MKLLRFPINFRLSKGYLIAKFKNNLKIKSSWLYGCLTIWFSFGDFVNNSESWSFRKLKRIWGRVKVIKGRWTKLLTNILININLWAYFEKGKFLITCWEYFLYRSFTCGSILSLSFLYHSMIFFSQLSKLNVGKIAGQILPFIYSNSMCWIYWNFVAT